MTKNVEISHLSVKFFLTLYLFTAALSLNAQTSTADNTAAADAKNDAYSYRIGIGDVLDIRIYNRPQLSREAVRVDGRGMIRMPLIEKDIQAVCRTDSELARQITELYLEYLRTPHVEVFIKDYQSKPVAILGAVRSPGRFQMQRKVRLLELLSFAGGPTEDAGGRIQVKHETESFPCEIDKTESTETSAVTEENVNWYELKSLLANASDETNNPVVRPGDVVVLGEANKIYVVGNIYKPTMIPLKEQITLSQAIAIAGGTLPDTNFDRVRISRQSRDGTKSEIIADIKAINKRTADDIVLQANDIVEVPSSSRKKFVRSLINSIAPTVTRLPLSVIP